MNVVELSSGTPMPPFLGAAIDVDGAAEDRQRTFAMLLEVAYGGLLVHDFECVLEVNEELARIYGRRPDDLVGQPILRLLFANDREVMAVKLEQPTVRYETRALRPDGTVIHLEVCAVTINAHRRVAAVRDITLRKTWQNVVAESEDRFRLLCQAAFDAILVHKDGVIETVSDKAAAMFGCSTESILGRSIFELTDSSHHATVREYVHERKNAAFVSTGVRADGTRFPLEVCGVTQEHTGRRVVALRDITTESRDRQQLIESEQHFRSIIENISDTITVVDAQGRIQYSSPSLARLLGRAPAELGECELVELVHPDDRAAAATFIAGQLACADGATLDARLMHRDGTCRWLSMVTTRRVIHGVVSLIVNGRDVTERRLLVAQLEQANRVNGLGRLAATVAHEFNNVLMGMQPFAELMQRPGISPEAVTRGSGFIVNSIARGKRVALDILRFTQPAEPSLVPVDLSAWFARIAPELEAGTGNNIRFDSDVPPGLGVVADAAQLAQLLSNLVSNARDSMPGGGALHVSARRPGPRETFAFGVVRDPGTFVQISVSDTGTGMTEQVARHVFDPLYTTKQNGGTGLGLAVVHQIVTRHGGSIFVNSNVGEGTTFHVFLPAANVAAEIVLPSAQEDAELRDLRVLVVDDEQTIAEGLGDVLAEHGAVVTIAKGFDDAFDVADRFRPQAAVIDIKLQDGDGVALGNELLERHPGLQIIFASGHADPQQVTGSGAFLQKPFETSDLVRLLTRLCRGGARR